MASRASKANVVEREDGRGGATFDQIAARAYEIHLSGAGGDELENWLRAEQELSDALPARSGNEHVSPANLAA